MMGPYACAIQITIVVLIFLQFATFPCAYVVPGLQDDIENGRVMVTQSPDSRYIRYIPVSSRITRFRKRLPVGQKVLIDPLRLKAMSGDDVVRT